jgi:hypothetical protein
MRNGSVGLDNSAGESWSGDGGGEYDEGVQAVAAVCWAIFFAFGIPQFPMP